MLCSLRERLLGHRWCILTDINYWGFNPLSDLLDFTPAHFYINRSQMILDIDQLFHLLFFPQLWEM